MFTPETIHLTPSFRDGQRDYVIITGPSGYGKSTAAADYTASYINLYPDRSVYLFSEKEKDDVYADVEDHITRIPISEWKSFMQQSGKSNETQKQKKKKRRVETRDEDSDNDDDTSEIFPDDSVSAVGSSITTTTTAVTRTTFNPTATRTSPDVVPGAHTPSPTVVSTAQTPTRTFEKCLMIFDDVENLDDEYRKMLVGFKNTVTQLYRQKGVDVIECNHKLLSGHISRVALAECTHVVFFIQGIVTLDTRNFLATYAGLDKATINYLLSQNTRWLCFVKFAPYSFLTPNRIRILQNTNE